MDRQHDLVSRHVDAGHGGDRGDDFADGLASADCADADRCESASAAARAAGGSNGGYLRPPPTVDLLADVDACFGGCAGVSYLYRPHLSVGAAGVYFSSQRRLGDEQSGVASDRSGAGSAGAYPGYGFAERSEQQFGARRWSCTWRLDGCWLSARL